MKGYFVNSLLVIFSLAISLLGADFGVFVAFGKKAVDQRGLYVSDSRRGHALHPGFSGKVSTDYTFDVEINKHGYRDIAWSFTTPNRVMVVGDSFTFGTSLPYEEGFVPKARAALPPSVALYNLGVPGYGLMQVLETLKMECRLIRPQHVLYMYYLNDMRENTLATDRSQVVDGYLVPTISPEGVLFDDAQVRELIASTLEGEEWSWAAGAKLLHIRRLLNQHYVHPTKLLELISGIDDIPGAWTQRYVASSNASYPPDIAPRAADVVRAMKQATEDCGATFTMVILPSEGEGYYGIIEPATENLLGQFEKGEIEIFDLRANAQRGVRLSLARDSHYNENATTWVAEELVERIRSLFAAGVQ